MHEITLLVADDEQIVRSFIRHMVAEEKLPVAQLFQAADGVEAVEMASAQQPDLVLLDIRMPGLSGLEAAERIKLCSPLSRVVILTAYDDFEYARRAFRSGAMDYLLKPVRPDEVQGHIMKVYKAKCEAAKETQLAPSARETHAQEAQGSMAALLAPETMRTWPAAVRAAAEYAAAHLDEKFTLADLAKAACTSPFHLSRIFSRHTGRTLMNFVLELRVAKAKELLGDAALSITEVAEATGFASPAYFADCFKKLTGCSPSSYKKRTGPSRLV